MNAPSSISRQGRRRQRNRLPPGSALFRPSVTSGFRSWFRCRSGSRGCLSKLVTGARSLVGDPRPRGRPQAQPPKLSESYRFLTIGLRDKVAVPFCPKARQSGRAKRDKVAVDNYLIPQGYSQPAPQSGRDRRLPILSGAWVAIACQPADGCVAGSCRAHQGQTWHPDRRP